MTRFSMRVALLVLWLSPLTAHAQLILPPFVLDGGHQTDVLVHDGFLDATLYGADPTGTTDSTDAIQRAMNDGRDYALATYLPAGTYLVSDTLLGWEKLGYPGCVQNLGGYGVVMPNEPYVDEAAQAPSLIGPPNGQRAVLKLANNAFGFNSTSSPKPVIHMVNLYPDGGIAGYEGFNPDPRAGASDCLFYAVVRDVDLTLGTGNSGAIGVQFYSAQMSYMANVNVDATGAYAGIQGAPATSDWTNLSVTGGQYGLIVDYACGANSLAGITVSNQTAAGLSISACGATTVSGFAIDEPNAAAVVIAPDNGVPESSAVALIDGTITQASGAQPAISNPSGLNLFAENVFVQTPGALLQSGGQPDVPGSGGTDLIAQYVYTDTVITGGNYAPNTSYNLVNGVRGQQELVNTQLGAGNPPLDLVLRHLPGPLPWITDTGLVDATTLGADPLGTNDSTAGIQAAINAGTEVFLPRGDYQISGTLQLQANTHLFGVPGMRTGLYAPNWSPNATFLPFIQSANSATGTAYLGDLNFQMPDEVSSATTGYDQSYLGAIDWQTGRSSIVNQIGINLDYDNNTGTAAARDLVHVEKNGGGRWYGLQSSLLGGYSRDNNPGFRFILVDGTTTPLTFYGPNLEHAGTPTFMEVTGASNVRVHATKTENNDSLEWIVSSNNVQLAGLNGDWSAQPPNPGVLVSSSTNVILSGLGWYANESNASFMVYETNANGTDAGIPYADGVSLYQRGTFDETQFPHCGDGTCDGAETGANCPADCAGTSATTGATSGAGATSSTGTTTGGTTSSTSTSSSSSSSGASWTACKTNGPPSWTNVPSFPIPYTDAVILSDAPDAPTGNAQLSASVQVAWDNGALYAQVQVTEQPLVNSAAVAPYYDNAVELYLDEDDSRTPTYDAGDAHLIVSADGRISPASGFTSSASVSDGGYVVDFTVPLSGGARALGFDVAIDGNFDGGAMRASQLMWSGDGGAYLNPQQFGTLILSNTVCGANPGTTTGGNGSSGGTSSTAAGSTSGTTGTAAASSSSGGTTHATGGCSCGATTDPPSIALLVFALAARLGKRRQR